MEPSNALPFSGGALAPSAATACWLALSSRTCRANFHPALSRVEGPHCACHRGCTQPCVLRIRIDIYQRRHDRELAESWRVGESALQNLCTAGLVVERGPPGNGRPLCANMSETGSTPVISGEGAEVESHGFDA